MVVERLLATESLLAKSYYDEPYWPTRHVLAWIRFQTPDFLIISYEDIRSLNFQALWYKTSPWPSPLVTENPADILRKRLKARKIEAIRPDGAKMPPVSWYRVGHNPSTWPEALFLRDDVLRDWPEHNLKGEPQPDEGEAGKAAPEEVLSLNKRKRRAVDAAIRELGVDALAPMDQKRREAAVIDLVKKRPDSLTVTDRYVRGRFKVAKEQLAS